LDIAALARILRLPPAALRIVDLSALAAAARQAESRRLSHAYGDEPLAPRLAITLDVLAPAPGLPAAPLACLVFAPGPPRPRAAPRRTWASPLDFWRDRLPELPPPPELPAGSPNPETRRRRHATELDAETWPPLRARAARAGLSPAAVLLAAFADVLAAWSESPRYTLAVEVPGGLGSWLPLAVDGSAPGGFETRARALQERLEEGLAWPLAPGERLEPLPDLPVAFVARPALLRHEGKPRDDDEAATRRAAVGRRGRAPDRALRLEPLELEGVLRLDWTVADERFPPEMAEALLGACRDLLRRLAGEDEAAWTQVRRRLIPPQQLARIVAFNSSGSPVPEPYLHAAIAGRAHAAPERIALRAGAERTTYGELIRAAERLGRRLQAAGARRNAPVAIALDGVREPILAALGALAAGAAWLPVDPALPPERLRALLERGRIELAVARSREGAGWPEEVRVFSVDEEEDKEENGTDEAGAPAVPSASPKDLACVLFDGAAAVMIENRGAANLATDLARRFGLGPEDRMLALAPLTDGRCLAEVFATLAAGGQVVAPDPGGPEAWAAQIERDGITAVSAPAELIEALVAAGGRPRLLLASGALRPETLERLPEDVRVAELWGFLETTVWSMVREPAQGAGSPRLGEPLANQTAHILDERLELRPAWVPGDLWLGGLGLARGYWRDPARSAARFLVHPDTGERLFRTGRRARWLPDGAIELLDGD
jgi:non-ribosomal peptide synthetase component F